MEYWPYILRMLWKVEDMREERLDQIEMVMHFMKVTQMDVALVSFAPYRAVLKKSKFEISEM